jgi:hypothetical protein
VWPIELFLGFYDNIVEDLMRSIELRSSRRILTTFNAIVLVLIPKCYNLSSFEEYKPISL